MLFPRYKLTCRSHGNIHFRLDDCHPVGGSQHQKVVVIDDALAFAGGLDVSKSGLITGKKDKENIEIDLLTISRNRQLLLQYGRPLR